MKSRIRLFGHPAHQTLVHFPLGLLAGSVLFDVLGLVLSWPAGAVIAYWTMAAGIVGGLVVAPLGLIDLVAIPEGTRAARIGRWHGAVNCVVLALFIGSWIVRRMNDGAPTPTAVALSFVAVGFAVMAAWLGGELVTRLTIGVADGSHPNAPSSLDAPLAARPLHTPSQR